MNTSLWRRCGRLWVQGAVLLLLRLWQNRAGFDPATGLARPGLSGTLLPVCLVVFAAVELLYAGRLPGEKSAYAEQFDPPGQKLLPAAAAGCLLLSAGGVLSALAALPVRDMLAMAAGGLAVAAGAGLLFLLRQTRAGEDVTALAVLPSMLFGVCDILAVYISSRSDPVLARVWLPILAAALLTMAFSQLGGFLHSDSSPRSFVGTADLAVLLCLAAMADGGAPRVLLYGGCALTLTVFLVLRREPERYTPRHVRRQEP